MNRRPFLLVAPLLSACTLQHWQPSQAVVGDDHMAHMVAADLRYGSPAPRIGAAAQGTPGLPASASTAAARLGASPRHGEWVKIAWSPGSADSLMAWIVYPVRRDKAPVVVVVHEIFGLSTWVRSVADQVAAEGYIAIAPDLVSRVRGGPTTVELSADSARRIIQRVYSAEINLGITAAANFAMTLPSAQPRYGVIGYCWGGTAVWDHVVNGGVMGFAGGVAFYGTPYSVPGTAATATTPATPARPAVDSLAKIKVPVMLLSGTGDARITAAMPGIEAAMKELGRSYFGKNYEGAAHGFLRAQDDLTTDGQVAPNGAANLAATKDAWPMTVAFLRKNLGN